MCPPLAKTRFRATKLLKLVSLIFSIWIIPMIDSNGWLRETCLSTSSSKIFNAQYLHGTKCPASCCPIWLASTSAPQYWHPTKCLALCCPIWLASTSAPQYLHVTMCLRSMCAARESFGILFEQCGHWCTFSRCLCIFFCFTCASQKLHSIKSSPLSLQPSSLR